MSLVLMDESAINERLRTIKKELKDWEHQFQEKEGRKPSKDDIRSDATIARKYKNYAKLKATVDGSEAPTRPSSKKASDSTPNLSSAVSSRDLHLDGDNDVPVRRVSESDAYTSKKSRSKAAAAAASVTFSGTLEGKDAANFHDSGLELNADEPDEDGQRSRDHIPASKINRPRPHGVSGVRKTSNPGQAPSSKSGEKSEKSSKRQHGVARDSNSKEASVGLVQGDILAMETPQQRQPGVTTIKANYLSKDALYASTSSAAWNQSDGSQSYSDGLQQEKQRPWGSAAALPENFKLRKSTIASGPIATDESLQVLQQKKIEEERNQRAQKELSEQNRSPYGSAFYSIDDSPIDPFRGIQTDTRTEFQDFMNRRNILATQAPSQSPARSFNNNLLPISTPNTSASPVSESPTITDSVTSPVVKIVERPPSPTNMLPIPSPPRKIDLSAYAKPYDPTEESDDDEDKEDESSSPTGPVTQNKPPSGIFGDKVDAKKPELDIKAAVPPASLANLKENGSEIKPCVSEVANAGTVQKDPIDIDDEEEKNAVTPLTGPAPDEKALTLSEAKPVEVQSPKIFLRIPQDGILRCKLYRKKNLLDKTHPTFFLYNESDEKFLLAARKRKKSKTVNYLISDSQDDLTKDSAHYVAKLKANFQRTNFTLLDARHYNKMMKNKGLREVASVSYSKTVLPREMSVAIPAVTINEHLDGLSTDFMADIKAQNTEKLLFLSNKPPRWNETTQSHCLNFGGRVTQPSIKNFQLIMGKNDTYIVMQFGRCGPDYFTLDVRYPMTPIEAFAIALTTFDAYDSA